MLKTSIVRANYLSQRYLKAASSNPSQCSFWRSQTTTTISHELDSEPASIKASFRKKLETQRQRALIGGGEKRIEKQHARGSLTARERLDCLFDHESFCEVDQMKVHRCQEFGMDSEENKIPGDGVVTGHVRVSCVCVCVCVYIYIFI